jgi:hypothetical protein
MRLAHATDRIKEAKDVLQDILASRDSIQAQAPSLLSRDFIQQLIVENLPPTPSALPPKLPKVTGARVIDQPEGPLRAMPATDEQPQHHTDRSIHGGSLRTVIVIKGRQCDNCMRLLASGSDRTAKQMWLLPQCEDASQDSVLLLLILT